MCHIGQSMTCVYYFYLVSRCGLQKILDFSARFGCAKLFYIVFSTCFFKHVEDTNEDQNCIPHQTCTRILYFNISNQQINEY